MHSSHRQVQAGDWQKSDRHRHTEQVYKKNLNWPLICENNAPVKS